METRLENQTYHLRVGREEERKRGRRMKMIGSVVTQWHSGRLENETTLMISGLENEIHIREC